MTQADFNDVVKRLIIYLRHTFKDVAVTDAVVSFPESVISLRGNTFITREGLFVCTEVI